MPPIGNSRVSSLKGLVGYEPDVPASGVSRWTFDDADTSSGTAIDSWGDNDGSIVGATTGVSGANQTYTTNEAYSFDGTDDRVELPDMGLTSSNSFSIALWARPDVTGEGSALFGRNDGTENVLEMHTTQSDTWAYNMGHAGGNRHSATGGGVAAGEWSHIVLTFDASALESVLYENGSVVGNDSSSLDDFATSNGPWIGGRNDNSRYFDGREDDIRVYDKALTDTEVNDLYNTGSI